MAYTDISFFLFFAVAAGIYFVIPKRCRSAWLLLASYCYIFLWNVKSGFFVLAITGITYVSARLMARLRQRRLEEKSDKKGETAVFVLTLLVVFGVLAVMKYGNFVMANGVKLLHKCGVENDFRLPELLLPVGLSFYTFATVGYVIDVYTGKRQAEKNLIRYALFAGFFPNFSSGPIERSHHLLRQLENIQNIRLWDYNRIAEGVLYMLWGYFQKLVIADRAAILVNEVFGKCQSYGTTALVLAAVLFSVQIYADFAGGSYMAIGCAKILGFDLIDNFNAPYFALSIKDFWRRWHISLSTWFRDYLYIPLGGNRKGTARTYLNMMIVFLLCGMWHGANWTFLIWGLIHGLYQLIGGLTRDKRTALYQKLKIDTSSTVFVSLSRLCTFALTAFAWIFFRAGSLSQAAVYIWRMFTCCDLWNVMNGHIYELGLNTVEMNLLFCAVAVLFAVDYFRYKKKQTLPELLRGQQYFVRLGFAAVLVIAILFFGCYGSSFGKNAFIYADF